MNWKDAAFGPVRLRSALAGDAALRVLFGTTAASAASELAALAVESPTQGAIRGLRVLAGALVATGILTGAVAFRPVAPARAIAALLLVHVMAVLGGVPLVAFGPPLTRAGGCLLFFVETAAMASAVVTLGGLTHALPARWPVLRARARGWLVVAAVAIGAFGAAFAFAPGVTERYWDAVLYHGAPPAAAHAPETRVFFGVLGVVLAGWMALVAALACARAPRWSAIALSLLVWFLLDSAHSCLAGAEANAVSNVALALPLALCLAVLVAARPRALARRPIMVRADLGLRMPARDAFDLVTSVEGMLLFRGFGAVPGIVRVSSSPGPRGVGTTDRVTSSDGTSHEEAVTEHAPAHAYALRIGPFSSPLGRLASHMVERWTFTDAPDGVRVRRVFSLHATSWLARVALSLLVAPQLRAAMRRHHSALGARPTT